MRRVIHLDTPVSILAAASAVGYEEFRGPLGEEFDYHDDSDRFGEKTYERAEGELAHIALNLALKRARLSHTEIDLLYAGDLQNQCVASSGGLLSFGIPYIGLYGACSTLGEGLFSGAMALCAAKELTRVAVVTTSHNSAAERQFRLPLEYGGQRTPTAQWTATAGGAYILGRGDGVRITHLMAGRITDFGIRDAANMGAAMAPAACDSILTFLKESNTRPEEYDAIITGDLGREGSSLLRQMLWREGVDLSCHYDCGAMIYHEKKQDSHAGGSGCGCSAAVFAAHFFKKLVGGGMRRALLIPTGALMSPSSIAQGGSIAGIAPVICLEGCKC